MVSNRYHFCGKIVILTRIFAVFVANCNFSSILRIKKKAKSFGNSTKCVTFAAKNVRKKEKVRII